jgi:HK97 family phage major capsid protein
MAAERALSLGSTGIPIPYQLDPTVIPTSNSVVNPWRALCRTEQIVVNEWRGVTSGAVTAQYRAEGTETTDNTPTMAQPVVAAVRADAFIPFSIESGQDWSQLQTEMARLIADGKDDLESNKFFSGGGTNEPFGLNSMSAGTDVAATGAGAFVIADLYKLEEAVAPRFRPRSAIVGNRFVFNKARQFDTAGGSGVWFRNTGLQQGLTPQSPGPGNTGAELIGYPAYESSQMLAVLTTGSRILLMGDFRYYLIVDRVGMSIELIPHLFGAANRYPTGQRGLFAMWRNGGKPLSEAAFKFLKT